MKARFAILAVSLAVFLWHSPADAFLPDGYICDSAIYYGGSSGIKPNVLILLDTSTHMESYGTAPHDPDVEDDGAIRGEPGESFVPALQEVLKELAEEFQNDLKLGMMVYGSANKGGQVLAPVRDLEADSQNYAYFFEQADSLSSHILSSATARPINEALFDAMLYYMGKDHTNEKVANNRSSYGSPVDEYCQKNKVVIITTGTSLGDDMKVGNLVGGEGNVADVARYAYNNDLLPAMEKKQVLRTSMIQLADSKDAHLKEATKLGGGSYIQAQGRREMEEALRSVLTRVVRQRNSAIIAPVIPASPENRIFSGKRIYISFFTPREQEPWWGNLMKFGLVGSEGELRIVDRDGNPATETDGRFRAEARSFWGLDLSTPGDDAGCILKRGGAGAVLQSRMSERRILTLTDRTRCISDPGNRFETGNLKLTADLLQVDEEERYRLISYVRGLNAYSDDPEPRRPWLMGDILHSRPLVVTYSRYPFNAANEADPDTNRTYIFVGSNGGKLHAFRDVDGEEVWAFIPPELLPRLKYLREGGRDYYVDGSPSIYIHDADDDGTIERSKGDFAILVFGLRRGGGWRSLERSDPHGIYYALDVTDPEEPSLLWKIDSYTDGFSELAQTWSQPQFARVVVDGRRKIVAFVGAGYDNVEDLRYGSTQNHPMGVKQTGPTADFSRGMSADGGTNATSRGRGVFAIEIATLDQDGTRFQPNFEGSGNLVWGFTGAEYSVPSEVLVIDRTGNGLADRLYVGDTGGHLWRFDVGSSDVDRWTESARIIFRANPGIDGTSGRKIFSRPDATAVNSRNVMIYFGTGDRSHPTNYKNPGPAGAVIDRFYAVRDYDGNTAVVLGEDDLHDVTENILQQDLDPDVLEKERKALFAPDNFGWYIRLDTYSGEKVLAPASLFNHTIFFTTYQPHSREELTATRPCEAGNMGIARLYAVDARTGGAVFNFSAATRSDHQGSQTTEREPVLRRADRATTLGSGIPSGTVFVISDDGDVWVVTSVDMASPAFSFPAARRVIPLYWIQW
jgi:type IV pilus assembly protein PilY1